MILVSFYIHLYGVRVHPTHPTERRARVEIDGKGFTLAPDCDLVELMDQFESASRSQPTFVHLHGGDKTVSVLVAPLSKVVITVQYVRLAQPEAEPPFIHPGEWNL